MHPEISLMILSCNNWPFTLVCLNSLLGSLEPSELERGVEIIVVDNGSDAETRQNMLAYNHAVYTPEGCSLRFVLFEENLGYPGGVNAGLAHCGGAFIGVLNNDLVFPRGWLTPLIQILDTDKMTGFAVPFLSFAPSVQNLQKTFDSFEDMSAFAAKFTQTNAAKLLYTDRVIGACLLFRKDLLTTVGGNDFWFGVGNYDDDDWCLRARIAGYRIAVVGGSFVEHIGHSTFRLKPEWYETSMEANLAKFERKWKLKSETNPAGEFTREAVVKTTRYDRAIHYIPVMPGDFSPPHPSRAVLPPAARRWLFCADWSNTLSRWTAVFSALLPECEQVDLCFWVPASHFDPQLILAEIQRRLASSQVDHQTKGITFSLFQNDLPGTDILRLLGSADAVVEIPDDFVNRTVTYLAQQTGLNVKKSRP